MILKPIHNDTGISDRWPNLWGRVAGVLEDWKQNPKTCGHQVPHVSFCASKHGDLIGMCLFCLDRHGLDYLDKEMGGTHSCFQCGTNETDLPEGIVHLGNMFAWEYEGRLGSFRLGACCVWICQPCERKGLA